MLHAKIIDLKKEKIEVNKAEEFISSSKFGASLIFKGTVRENNDNKKVTDLLAKAKAADARHVEEKKALNNETKVDSTKMAKKDPVDKKKTSGVNYGTPLHGSYQNADDYHYVSNAADFQRLQDSIVFGAKAAMTPENIGNYQAKRAEKRKKRKGEDAKYTRIKERSEENLSSTNSKQQQDMADCIAAGGTYKNGVCS